MSPDEQASRAHQLLLYLPLVPVEYGRGVKGDQVTVDIEIRISGLSTMPRAPLSPISGSELNSYDQTTTDEIAASLATLDDQIQASAPKRMSSRSMSSNRR